MVDVARNFCILCLWALWVLSTAVHCVKTRATVVLLKKQRQRHFGGKMPCWPIGVILASLSLSYVYISLKNWRGQNSSGIWYGLHFSRKKEPIFTFILSRKNGWKKICLSIQNHGFKSIFIALLEMALSCWYFGALKGQESRGW